MKILSVHPGGLAAATGLLPGDEILTINGQAVRDVLDYRYHTADERLEMVLRRAAAPLTVTIEKGPDEDLGLTLEHYRYRRCANDCIFCFIDQNPHDLRQSLYFKDEDYRLSFMYGNYVTLTNTRREDLDRIVKQRLSPLYISIHALDREVRKVLLGTDRNIDVMPKMQYLINHGIELHGQVVLCPGINDGEVLRETVHGLYALYPRLRSLSIVPLGLTGHRAGLPVLHPVTPAVAETVMRQVRPWQRRFQAEGKEVFVYLSDEFYAQTGRPFPGSRHYGQYFQLENGVGMTRRLLHAYARERRRFPRTLRRPTRLLLLTGMLAETVLRRWVLPPLAEVEHLSVTLKAVTNAFFGPGVTVSGLLSGGDLLRNAEGGDADLIVLPPDCLNRKQVFLDDVPFETFQARVRVPVRLYRPGLFADWLRMKSGNGADGAADVSPAPIRLKYGEQVEAHAGP